MKAKTLLLILFVLSQTTFAKESSKVHLLTGAFHHKSKDDLIYSKSSLPIIRDYKSRSLVTGIFGFGWCSNLELSVRVISEESVQLINCDTVRTFQLKQNSHSFLSRQTHAVYFDAKNIGLTLEWVKNRFVFRPYQSNLEYTFSPAGRLINIEKNQVLYKVLYGLGQKIRMICHAKADECHRFEYNSDQLVSKIWSDAHKLVFKTYKTNLVRVEGRSRTKTYKYDTFNNLTVIRSKEQRTKGLRNTASAQAAQNINISYDTNKDAVTRVKRAKGCPVSYDYTDDQAGVYSVQETLNCKNRTQSKVYEFPYTLKNKKKVLLPTRSRYDLSQL